MITESYAVKRSLHGLLIGKKGSRLKQLTEETGTHIRVQRGKDQVIIDTMVNPDALVLPANFHITLGVMSLLDREEIDRAVKYFKEECSTVAHQVLENNPLSVRLQKLAIMQPNPV
ncbi:hypothetical protein BCV71DRAFT_242693 [Rhizopus microsporus]|uniref:A-kinase anchor protein 7-like phosphoesterase domain-containing protein n=1 Tax=Rhizopus microsporus TaxID=58291 RepID=A0A1X0S5U6_RHIZD|nr:hypothetical protein BCV71DRAFT_242693 [Rhizopus microsporus]